MRKQTTHHFLVRHVALAPLIAGRQVVRLLLHLLNGLGLDRAVIEHILV